MTKAIAMAPLELDAANFAAEQEKARTGYLGVGLACYVEGIGPRAL